MSHLARRAESAESSPVDGRRITLNDVPPRSWDGVVANKQRPQVLLKSVTLLSSSFAHEFSAQDVQVNCWNQYEVTGSRHDS